MHNRAVPMLGLPCFLDNTWVVQTGTVVVFYTNCHELSINSCNFVVEKYSFG